VSGAGDVYAGAYTQNGQSFAQVADANLETIGSVTALPQAIGGARAVAATGSTTGPIAAVTTIKMSTDQTLIYGIAADGSLSPPLALASANPIAESSLTNVGDRIAIVNASSVNNCFVRTIDLGIQSASATTGWGTANECTQPQLGYAPGRSDALLIRHDLTDGDLNHVVGTRNGVTYTIPGESRLRNPGNEPRPVGVADGYWVSYETGGTLEAAHVDFAGVVGTVAMLGPLADPTAHGTVVVAGEAYALWVQDGFELARLCQ